MKINKRYLCGVQENEMIIEGVIVLLNNVWYTVVNDSDVCAF